MVRGFTVILIMLFATLVACSPAPDGATDTVTPKVEYAEQSLYAYHANVQGEDITNITEVSVENCSSCHGDREAIQAKTAEILVNGSTVANPHVNHMTKEFECGDCHSLTEASSLACKQCHAWELIMDNGTWAG
jgi:hypothetical protein